MTKHDKIPILIDTREQNPLSFEGLDCTTKVGTVPVFDYALVGDEDKFAIERKSRDDFVNSMSTTKGYEAEVAKIKRANSELPIIYVVECKMFDMLPQRKCACWHKRGSLRCAACGGTGERTLEVTGFHTTIICECFKPRPARGCEWCEGSGIIGYDYDRRKIGSPYLFHQVSQFIFRFGVCVVFADSRVGAAAMIESLLRRRFNVLKLIEKSKENGGFSDEKKGTITKA